MTKLLNIFSNHGVNAMAELMKEKLQNPGCVPSFRLAYLSVSRSAFVAGVHTPYQ